MTNMRFLRLEGSRKFSFKYFDGDNSTYANPEQPALSITFSEHLALNKSRGELAP